MKLMESLLREQGEDRMAAIKAAQEKANKELADNLSYENVNILRGILRRKSRKKNPLSGVSMDTIEELQSYKLIDSEGNPTNKAYSFMRWLDDPSEDRRSQEMKSKQFRQAADTALSRGRFKKVSDPTAKHADPKAVKARKIIQGLTPDEREVFRKLFNKHFNPKTKNIAQNWGKGASKEELSLMKKKGIVDNDGELTDLGKLAVNAYIAFKDDPEKFERVPRARRTQNRGKSPKRQDLGYLRRRR